jgi:hypothetical protein
MRVRPARVTRKGYGLIFNIPRWICSRVPDTPWMLAGWNPLRRRRCAQGQRAGWWRVAGAAAELGCFPCSHALAKSSYADDVLCTVLLLVRRVFAMQAPAVPTIHREQPQGWASGELV